MRSSTITAFLLPLLLSSVLAVPTRVQNRAPVNDSPASDLVNIETNIAEAEQSAAADAAGRKPSLKGRQPDVAATMVAEGDTAPAAENPTEGESPEELYAEQGMESEDEAQAAGQDPSLCHGSCKRSLEGRQDDSEESNDPATDPNEDLPPIQEQIDDTKAKGVSSEQAAIDAGDATIGYLKSVGQDQEPGTT